MDQLQLSEPEQRYFGDLFLLCSDGDNNSAAVTTVKACELFRTSKLPNDVLRQITDLCSSSKSSELLRQEFYMALKMIAAAQAGLAVSTEAVSNGLEVPLPRFTWPSDETSDLIQLSEPTGGKNSPSASSTASDSPTPTNSVQDKVWAATTVWQGIACEEQRQLLGTEEESSDRHSSSEEAEPDSVWKMTEEQRAYYTKQFHNLEPKPSGLLPGTVARLFFEKSRLPVHELRQIWQLADVTKDGALSLAEFNIAMHLVVLRRNEIPLPDSLPPSLLPPQQPPPPPPREEPAPPSPGQSSISSETKSSKQWTKFVDSPTSSIASPGPKPVNFDFHKSAVEQDPKIFHPVAVRVTPEHQTPATEQEQESRNEPDQSSIEGPTSSSSTKRVLLQSYSADSGDLRPIKPIQRPTPRKPPPGPGAIPPPPHPIPDDPSGPTSLPVMCGKKEPPPPPPPRPYRTHARSSSLDLNKIGRSNSLQAPPAPPPRLSPGSTSPKKLLAQRSEADALTCGFPGGEDEGIAEVDGAPRRHGAFHVYRKHPNHCSPAETRLQSCDSVKRLEVQNSALALLCSQLNQELVQAQEERNLLQIKLDKLQARYDV